MSVLEELAAGLPVIGSGAGGIGEILEVGEYGIQFENGNIEELQSSLGRLPPWAQDRKHFSDKSASRVAMFSRVKMIEDVRSIYYSLAR